MNKFWAEMIISGQAKFSNIAGTARKNAVRALLGQYITEGRITQEDFDRFISE